MNAGKILVTGASGALGRLVVSALAERNVAEVLAGSRRPGSLSPAVPARQVNFDDTKGLAAAFEGVDSLLIISTDELAEPGRRQRQHRAALDAALAAGVRHIAYTSMPNPTYSMSIPFASDHVAMEADLMESGLRCSILRNAWYQENLLGYLPQIVASGTWFTAAGDGRIPFVSRADVAAATASVLTSSAQDTNIYDLAGPDFLSIGEIAAKLEEATGQRIVVQHVTADRLARELAAQGVPDFLVPMVVVTDLNQAAGAFETTPGDLGELVARPLTRLSDFLARQADLLRTPVHI